MEKNSCLIFINLFVLILLLPVWTTLTCCGQSGKTIIEGRLYKCVIEGPAPDSYYQLKEGDTAYMVYRKYTDSNDRLHEELFILGHYSESEKKMLDKAANGSYLRITLNPDVDPVAIPVIYPDSIKLVKRNTPEIEQEALAFMKSHGWPYSLLN